MVLRHRPHPVHPFNCFRVLLAALLLAAACPLFAKWAPVDQAELKDTKPRIDPEAGAEILLKEVEIRHHDFSDLESTYHLRVKIFSTRGLDDFAKVEIPYDNDTTIKGIEARTIKPDGTVIELDPKEIFDREVIKTNKTRVKVKSFAPPGLVVGAIVEYRYRVSSEDETYFLTLSFNSEQPSRLVKFRYSPITGFAVQVYLRWMFSNLPKQNTKLGSDDFYELSMTNVPALKEEPLSPPSYNSASSALIYYSLNKGDAPKDYWPQQRKELAESETAKLAPSGALKTALATIVAPGDDNTTKLRKIYDYCRTKITNRDRDTTSFTTAQQKKLKANKTATDIVTHGYGNSEDVNVLFTALARLAGLDAHFAMCNRRDLMLFNSQITEPFMLPDLVTVVYLDGAARYFDPGATYLPFGMLAWQNANTAIMCATTRGDVLVYPDSTPATDSVERRKAHFTLDEDGTLEGDVTITYSGYCDAEKKYLLDGQTTAEREAYYRDAVKDNLKQAEVTQIKIEHVTDPLEPMSVSYHLRVPEYGDRT
ncbi:MAG TPA: DUF3857 domain-containing protein, partial [Candidatus Didemnitutus sp.]|nr:DUF3857 domain-containing protein [Candidatus Didemnitutus sp.]